MELHLGVLLLIHIVEIHIVVVHVDHTVELLVCISVVHVEVLVIAHLNGGLHHVGVVHQQKLLVHVEALGVDILLVSLQAHVSELVHVVVADVVHVEVGLISHHVTHVLVEVHIAHFGVVLLAHAMVDRVH